MLMNSKFKTWGFRLSQVVYDIVLVIKFSSFFFVTFEACKCIYPVIFAS